MKHLFSLLLLLLTWGGAQAQTEKQTPVTKLPGEENLSLRERAERDFLMPVRRKKIVAEAPKASANENTAAPESDASAHYSEATDEAHEVAVPAHTTRSYEARHTDLMAAHRAARREEARVEARAEARAEARREARAEARRAARHSSRSHSSKSKSSRSKAHKSSSHSSKASKSKSKTKSAAHSSKSTAKSSHSKAKSSHRTSKKSSAKKSTSHKSSKKSTPSRTKTKARKHRR